MTWTTHKAAPEWGIDRKTLRRRLAEAGFNLDKQKEFTTQEINQAVYSDPKYERVLTDRVERELLELELAQKKGELVTMSEVVTIINDANCPLRDRLKAMPAECCNRCNPTDPELARAALAEWSAAALPIIRDMLPKVASMEEAA